MTENYPIFDEIQNVHQQLYDMRAKYQISHSLFTVQWSLLLIVLFIPWLIWWRFVEKERITQILLFGTLLMILIIFMDDFGVETHLQSYPYQLVNIIPILIPVDLGIIIIARMFLYQCFPEWKKFIIAHVTMAIIFTFVFEPLTIWLGIYKLEKWRYIYSLPIYILKVVLIKWLVDKLTQIREHRNGSLASKE